MPLKINQIAPAWRLLDQNGTEHQLSDYAGQWLLVYFYPRDNTPGCTVEACSFRDNFSALQKLGVAIVGVSVNSVVSHGKFVEQYKLPFTLLSDSEKIMSNDYGVMGLTSARRISFLIDKNGKIAKIYDPVIPKTHVDEIVADLKKL
ncbi:MAG: peroxiredoxin [Candidatus Magasanikbacteria bacterium RIFOXYC2_FULL_42_28]|uniref:thioredoxin-dependent peroxiredoxin n=1 Tax=Candidatus Magasanikbacteria bacterium RIFOXYC2_FULL_42_28 TaxID=1798704 RepID=A0A1F6NW91_9BACT|nr:MAG: peroxiredoxin [Candidatus Magasanikbacteria bacterium RIFOXYC2_FULL_42_28]